MEDSVDGRTAPLAEGLSMTWTDERVEIAEEAVERRSVGKSDRGRAWRHHAQRRDRQGASARACPAAPKARRAPRRGRARRARSITDAAHRSRPSIRGNTALAHAYEIEAEPEPELDRQHHSARPAPHHPRTDRGNLPLADRRPRQQRISSSAAARRSAGLPYCGYHSRVAYQPAGDRRRDRRPQR